MVELDGTGKIPAALIPSSGAAVLIGGNSTGSTLTMGTNDAQALALKANNAVAMTINTSGQVGIGNSFPSNRLDVGSGTDTSNTISVRGSQTTALDLLNTSFGGLWIGVNFSGASVNGIPTNSMGMSVGNSPIVFASGTPTRSERMRISNVGNVGIGVSFPTMKLEVGGTIRTVASSPNIEVKDSDSTNTQNAWTDVSGAHQWAAGYCPQPTSASWHENFMVINGDNLTVCANSAATYGYRCCKPLP